MRGTTAQALPDAGYTARVLVADDDVGLVRMLRRQLEPDGFEIDEATDARELCTRVAHQPDLVLLDLTLGGAPGTELIAEIRSGSPDSEIVVMTGYASVDSAVACIRAGAFDYLEKPFRDRHRVTQTLGRALEHRSLRVRNRELEVELVRRSTLERFVAQSLSMRRVVQMVRDLSRNVSNVLIEAESGTGKELIARALHEHSPRREGPFVAVDCGALPEGIFESELFGYEPGAFTGATHASEGLFRSASGGTLFLDEIGELPLLLQSKLLRAIQEREVRPLGSSEPIAVDVRMIAATNRELEAEVRAGRFRRDLFYRLRVISIALPPLRERPEDVPMLVSQCLDRCTPGSAVNGIEPEALEALLTCTWEGNVRELENTIEGAVALARGPRLSLADLRLNRTAAPITEPPPDGLPLALPAWERACIDVALKRVGGDVRRAAELLGVGRSTLYRKLKRNH